MLVAEKIDLLIEQDENNLFEWRAYLNWW